MINPETGKLERACRQCGAITVGRTMMESLLKFDGTRNRTVGVFCPTTKHGDPERCAAKWEAAHPDWEKEAVAP